MIQNERGITLTETLLTLTILSLVGIIIWNVFFQGTNYSRKAATRNELNQEANIIIENLINIHRKAKTYEILDPGTACGSNIEINAVYPDDDDADNVDQHENHIFGNPKMCYSLNPEAFTTINPITMNMKITLTVKEADNDSNNVEVDTLLYRLNGEGM